VITTRPPNPNSPYSTRLAEVVTRNNPENKPNVKIPSWSAPFIFRCCLLFSPLACRLIFSVLGEIDDDEDINRRKSTRLHGGDDGDSDDSESSENSQVLLVEPLRWWVYCFLLFRTQDISDVADSTKRALKLAEEKEKEMRKQKAQAREKERAKEKEKEKQREKALAEKVKKSPSNDKKKKSPPNDKKKKSPSKDKKKTSSSSLTTASRSKSSKTSKAVRSCSFSLSFLHRPH